MIKNWLGQQTPDPQASSLSLWHMAPSASTGSPGTASGPPATPAAPTNIGAPDTTYLASVDGSAVGQSMQDLAEFGLTGPDAQAAVNWYTQQEANLVSPAQMQINMYQQPWFQKAFPGIIQQIQNGQSPMSPQDYVTFKQGVKDFSAQYGLPPGFVNDNDIANMIGKGWTYQDFTSRVGQAFSASANALVNNPQAVSLLDKWYGIKPGSGALAAFYLDPERTTSALAQATTAAEAGASAEQAGFTKLDQHTLMSLAANHSLSEIQSGIASATPLLPTTRKALGPGNSATASEQDLLESQVGGANGQTQEQAIEHVNVAAGQRTAAFRGGGGAVGTGQPGQNGVGFGTQ